MPLLGGYQKTTMLLLSLLLLVLVSALAVVYVSYLNRASFVSLTSLSQRYNELRVDYGRLQLEYSTWASPAYIEQAAVKNLGMQSPKAGQIVLVSTARLAASDIESANYVANGSNEKFPALSEAEMGFLK